MTIGNSKLVWGKEFLLKYPKWLPLCVPNIPSPRTNPPQLGSLLKELSSYNTSPACWAMSFLPWECGAESKELSHSFYCVYITHKAWVLWVDSHVPPGRWRNKGSWSIIRRKNKPVEWRIERRARVLTGVQIPESCFVRDPKHFCPWVPWYTECPHNGISCWNLF